MDERRSNECQHKFTYIIDTTNLKIFTVICTDCDMRQDKEWSKLRTEDKRTLKEWVGCGG